MPMLAHALCGRPRLSAFLKSRECPILLIYAIADAKNRRGLVKVPYSPYPSSARAMISSWISLLPPKMLCERELK